MAQRDRAAVNVDLCRIELEVAHARDRLRRERLVQLDEVDRVDREASPLQRLARCRNRPEPHAARIDTRDRTRHYPRERLRPPLTAPDRLRPPGGEEEGGGPVPDPARA